LKPHQQLYRPSLSLRNASMKMLSRSRLSRIIVGTTTNISAPRTNPVFAHTLLSLSTGAGVDFNAIQPKTTANIAFSMPMRLTKQDMPRIKEIVAYAYFWPKTIGA